MHAQVKIYPTPAAVAAAAADHFLQSAVETVTARGVFSVALSGGSTPALLFEILSASPYLEKIPWDHIAVFWGDERAVPPAHRESNYRAARELLLDRVPIPKKNVFRIHAELDPRLAAARYEDTLRDFLGIEAGDPQEVNSGVGLDLVYLGMGGDGHTASLFPHTPALQETSRWVVGNYVEQLETWRITMTAPFINAARQIVFLVTGEGKKTRLKEVLAGTRDPQALPSQLIKPQEGALVWLVDAAAAAAMDEED